MKKWLLVGFGFLTVIGLTLFLAFGRDGVLLGMAALNNETRPDFLEDARWHRPQSAAIIKRRFPAGSKERVLIQSLTENKFVISDDQKSAERTLRNVPCNEVLKVNWSVTSDGRLISVDGSASDGGCL
jgi:hypothetical protein